MANMAKGDLRREPPPRRHRDQEVLSRHRHKVRQRGLAVMHVLDHFSADHEVEPSVECRCAEVQLLELGPRLRRPVYLDGRTGEVDAGEAGTTKQLMQLVEENAGAAADVEHGLRFEVPDPLADETPAMDRGGVVAGHVGPELPAGVEVVHEAGGGERAAGRPFTGQLTAPGVNAARWSPARWFSAITPTG